MNTLFKDSLTKSYTYKTYRELVTDLLHEGKSTGPNQSDELTNYSKLNDHRMNRLDKTVLLTPESISGLKSLNKNYIWLVISEGWCGDAAQILPVLNKMASETANIDMQIVLRDENEALMDAYLTNGGRSIPKLIVIDAETGEEVGNWGPRPADASQLVGDLKARYGGITNEVKEGLQKWYNDDKGISVQKEILRLLEKPVI